MVIVEVLMLKAAPHPVPYARVSLRAVLEDLVLFA